MKRAGVLAVLVVLMTAPAHILAQTPTPPDPTPTPRVTPTPDPGRPARIRDDGEATLFVSSEAAPGDYRTDRHRGTVPYTTARRNYSYQFVILPATRPLTISDTNFAQDKAGNVTFWRVVSAGSGAGVALRADRVLPDGWTATTADVGCRVTMRGPGWFRGTYDITGIVGARWQLDRDAAAANSSAGVWAMQCPVKDFRDIAFVRCNLTNCWLPAVRYRPTMTESYNYQGDMP